MAESPGKKVRIMDPMVQPSENVTPSE